MKKIIVGKIINTHGIRGELKVQRTNNEPFDRQIDYYIGDLDNPFEITKARIDGQIAYIKLKDYDNINDVLVFKNKLIYVSEADLYDLDQDEFYIKDLIGLEVIGIQGEKIGYIKDVLTYAANDIYLLECQDGEKLVPAVKEFIKKVDLESGQVIIDLIEGM